MNLQNYYWYYRQAVPAHICDAIVKYGLQTREEMAITGGYGNQKLNQRQVKDLKKKRDSNIVWISENLIYKELHPYISSSQC